MPRPSERSTSWLDTPTRAGPALVAALLLPALVYHSITRNYFHADDFLHLQDIANESVARFVLTPMAGHLYLVRNVVFELCHWAFGTNPVGYLWVAFLTHLLNVGLLFAV